MSRHKWEPLVPAPDIPGVYKTSVCNKCGCVRLHIYESGYRKSYLKSGQIVDKIPECNIIIDKNENNT